MSKDFVTEACEAFEVCQPLREVICTELIAVRERISPAAKAIFMSQWANFFVFEAAKQIDEIAPGQDNVATVLGFIREARKIHEAEMAHGFDTGDTADTGDMKTRH